MNQIKLDELIEQIRIIKEDQRLSNEALAQKIGVSLYTIHRWLNGKGKMLHPSTIRLIENFLYSHKKHLDNQ